MSAKGFFHTQLESQKKIDRNTPGVHAENIPKSTVHNLTFKKMLDLRGYETMDFGIFSA